MLVPALPVRAQEPGPEVTIPQEYVRYDYAQVLSVEPVYQVLRTSRMERVCDVVDMPPGVAAAPTQENPLERMVSSLRQRLSGGTTREEREAGLSNCRMAPVVREVRRAIAYDVDYVYRGSKFRTRMDRDPGNRVRVRVSVTPVP
nr:hypothetical protein [Thermomonas flagellata]